MSKGSMLHWVGWADENTLFSVDDSCTVRMLITNSQPKISSEGMVSIRNPIGMWVPVSLVQNTDDLFHWVVGFSENQMIYVECKAGDRFPVLLARYSPPTSSIPFHPPFISQLSSNDPLYVSFLLPFPFLPSLLLFVPFPFPFLLFFPPFSPVPSCSIPQHFLLFPFSYLLIYIPSLGENRLFISRIQLQNLTATQQITHQQQQLDKLILRLFHVREPIFPLPFPHFPFPLPTLSKAKNIEYNFI